MYEELTPLQALDYLDDIAHGRKMSLDPHELKLTIEAALKEYCGFQIVFELSNRNEGKNIHDKFKALEIIKKHKLLNYVIKNKKCASMYKLTDEEIETLKENIL